MKICFFFTAIFSFFLYFLTAQNLSGDGLDKFIYKIIEQNKLPGLSIAIVKDDSVIYSKGFGIRKLGETDPVNEHTLFETASLTKSFSATLIGMLVERGKINWSDPVIKYIPDFETSEPFATRILTIQDLLTLRSGFIDGDKLVCATRRELIPLVKNLKISESFRLSQSSYNFSYALVGLITEIITGKSWEDLVKTELFSPLVMKETFTDIPPALSTKNAAVPHRLEKGQITPIEWKNYGILSPAEGIYSNVMDLSKWIRLQMNRGTFENLYLIKPETLEKMQTPHSIAMNLFRSFFNPESNLMAIGLGWFISDYKGLKVVQMGGLADGTTNLITLIPSKRIGIIIQSNRNQAFGSFTQINYKVIDELVFGLN